jgi:thioredoxin reductase (NADPH)
VQNLAYLTGEERLRKILFDRPNVEIIYSSVVEKILGNESLTSIEIKNTETEERRSLKLNGMFVCIGQTPENKPFESRVKLDSYGYITADESCVPEGSDGGIFVAGDCRTKTVRQVTTAVSDGAAAALAACRFIDELH